VTTDDKLRAEVDRLRSEVETLSRTIAKLAEHMFGGQISGLLSMLGYQTQVDVDRALPYGAPGDPPVDSQPRVPLRAVEDVLPRSGRNPRIFCEQYDSGTWIHGRPHDCPPWTRHA